ncbi:MAG: tripartite tricarboxylate transporter substrate binding protein, partial [Comamonadaceae bacterium]
SSAAAGFAKAGKVKLLAVTSSQRLPDFPNVPTAAELGVKSVAGSGVWLALLVPARTPAATVTRLNTILNETLRAPDVAERLAAIGMTAIGGTPGDYDKLMHDEQRVWTTLIKESNITPD